MDDNNKAYSSPSKTERKKKKALSKLVKIPHTKI